MDAGEKPKQPPQPAQEPASRDDIIVAAHRCPFCHEDVRGDPTGPLPVACSACLARHHEACWAEAGRCSACGDATALRAEPPRRAGPRSGLLAALIGSVGLLVAVGGVVAWRSTIAAQRAKEEARRAEILARAKAERRAQEEDARLAREEAERRAREAERLAREDADRRAQEEAERRAREEAERRAREEAERLAREAARRAEEATEVRFEIARRVDELRALKRRGSRADARLGRRAAAAADARLRLYLLPPGSKEEARAKPVLAQLELRFPPPPPPGAPPPATIQDYHEEYFMPPRPEHPDYADFMAKMGSRGTPAYSALVSVLQGDARAGLERADAAIDSNPWDWLAWYARGQAQLALEDPQGAALSFTLCEVFTGGTWALLGAADVAAAMGDPTAELRAAWEALEVGNVPDFGGHHEALLERIARLERVAGPIPAAPPGAPGK